MGRKRKIRWRRLSIGGNSGNEEEEAERESEILGFSKMNPPSRLRSGSQPAIVNSYSSPGTASPSPLTAMNGGGGSNGGSASGNGGKFAPGVSAATSPESKSSDETNGPLNGFSTHSNSNHNHHHHNNGHHRGDYNGHGGGGHGHNGSDNYKGSSSRGDNYHSSNGYYPSSNYYHHRNSYNSGGSSYRGGGGGGYEGGGYRGRGSGDYHGSSRFGGRFRKPRPYASNYYYNNGPSSSGSTEEGNTNRPSYNQEEYTKITTPRQDVLFKKGYLSQRKAVTQSSVDSTSGPTTPSTNGTPDTHSTNGINSDYSEGYENGETECGLVPYDDTVYYGLPPETAVFTDPNTGQVYYGQSNGEYFDAYPLSPVMMGGYPPVYYHLPYPGMDWNGLPAPFYPIVPLGPPPLDDHHSSVQNGETQKGEGSSSSGKGSESSDPGVKGRKGDSTPGPPTPLTNGTHKNSSGGKRKGGEGVGTNGTLSDSSTSSSREGSTSTFSSAASTPLSPPGIATGQLMTSLQMSMANMNLVEGQGPLQPLLPQMPPPIPVSHFMAHPVPPGQGHHPHHPQPILYHPHPAAFVYAPPLYNGVVLPIAPVASSAEAQSSPSSRKKRKLRRRKKDDGQLTDESSSEEETISAVDDSKDADQESLISTNANQPLNLTSSNASSQSTSSETSPSKSSQSAAIKRDLISEGPQVPPNEIPSSIGLEEDLAPQIASSPALNFDSAKERRCLLAPKPLQSNQSPSEGDEVVKPDCTPVAGGPSQSESPPESVESSSEGSSSLPPPPAQEPFILAASISKKRHDLDLDLISTCKGGLHESLLPSPESLEPSSPDSFNTTQSLAGSEVPSVSISETDFMNRTTSVDEVEEDLPPEGPLLDTVSTDIRSPVKKLKSTSRSLDEESEGSEAVTQKEPLTSDPVPIPAQRHLSFDNSPPLTPNDSEPSPSPETIFERKLELPVLSPVQLETEGTLSCDPLESAQVLVEEETVELVQVETEAHHFRERASITATVPRSAACDDVECVSIQGPSVTYVGAEEEGPSVERPQSIMLAVEEWLKVSGPDVLTPVNQLHELFEDAGEDEYEDSEDESLQLRTEDLTKFDSVAEGPSKGPAPSCAIQ